MSTKLDEHKTRLTEEDAEVIAQAAANDEPEIETESDDAEERTMEDDASEDDLQQVTTSTPTQSEALAPGNLRRRVPQMKSARDDEPYEFERCTVLVTLQLTPLREGQPLDARKVFVSARTHSHPPYVIQARWGELESRLPDEVNMLLQRVQQDLPERAAERRAAEDAERQRQAQLQAESEKRRAAKNEKANAKKSSTPKRGKIDMNAPPKLPVTDANSENQSQVTTATIMPAELVSTVSSAPLGAIAPLKPEEPAPQMTLF